MSVFKRGSLLMACLLLTGCLSFTPSEEEITRFLTDILAEKDSTSTAPPKVTKFRCKLMEHGQSHECKVEYQASAGSTPPETGPTKIIYMIVRKVDGAWTLYEHRDKY